MSRFIPRGISEKVPLFPPGAPVAVSIDGRPLAAYVRAYVSGGRVYVPVAPLLTRLADRLWLDGDILVVQRGERSVRIRLEPIYQAELRGAYVPAAATLRALGATVTYDGAEHRLNVTVPVSAVVATPTPFNPAAPSVAPNAVFTPVPPATPRPLWTGSPMPRRTALPFPPPV
jgi:hypothetical protein